MRAWLVFSGGHVVEDEGAAFDASHLMWPEVQICTSSGWGQMRSHLGCPRCLLVAASGLVVGSGVSDHHGQSPPLLE